jgi:hypothetical protein
MAKVYIKFVFDLPRKSEHLKSENQLLILVLDLGVLKKDQLAA